MEERAFSTVLPAPEGLVGKEARSATAERAERGEAPWSTVPGTPAVAVGVAPVALAVRSAAPAGPAAQEELPPQRRGLTESVALAEWVEPASPVALAETVAPPRRATWPREELVGWAVPVLPPGAPAAMAATPAVVLPTLVAPVGPEAVAQPQVLRASPELPSDWWHYFRRRLLVALSPV